MRASDGQNMFDVCLQAYGELSSIIQLLSDNDLSLDDTVKGNQAFIVDSNAGNNDVKKFSVRSRIIFNNSTSESDTSVLGGDYNDDYNNDYN